MFELVGSFERVGRGVADDHAESLSRFNSPLERVPTYIKMDIIYTYTLTGLKAVTLEFCW